MRGHLRQRGDVWELRAYAGRDPVSGRKLYRTRSFRGGKRDAEDALARLVLEVSGAVPTARDATVGDLVAEWFELAKADLSPSTVRGYEVSIRRYITPVLGEVPLDQLRPAQLDQLYARMRAGQNPAERPLATATIRLTHAILRRALQQGVKWGWLSSNPAVLATPPRVRHRTIDAPLPESVGLLIDRAASENEDLGAFLQLAATTGARRGELCALRWSAVDLDGGALTIACSMVHGADGLLVEKDTKTHSVRRVALDPMTVDVLRGHRARCCARALACGTSLGKGAYVFSRAADSSTPWPPNDMTHAFIRLRDRLGLTSIRLHDLRHFAATRLLGAGIPVRTVSGRDRAPLSGVIETTASSTLR
jgi:integrase